RRLWLLKHACLLLDSLLSTLLDLVPSWISKYLRWCPTSSERLEEAERRLLAYVKKPFQSKFVTIDSILKCKGSHQIRTIEMGPTNEPPPGEERAPLVLVHGFASGVALWLLNLEKLSEDRTVYCFDTLGFGRSSRPRLSSDSLEAEYQFVQSLEEWRAQVGLDRFVLLGHSMGGFLAASYALRFPERVAHLVLADPWGFPERRVPSPKALQLPTWVRAVSTLLSPFNPLVALRVAGPWGAHLPVPLETKRRANFISTLQRARCPHLKIILHHGRSTGKGGESAFKAMMTQYGWARHPMVNRIAELHVGVPMTFIYGSKSWVDKQPGIQVQQVREESEVDVEIIEGAGHHVFADRPDHFNDMVCKICRNTDAAERIIRALAEHEDDEKADEKHLTSSARLLRSEVLL
ncbi:unnamed protein product, partial [Ixodes hexagonus]